MKNLRRYVRSFYIEAIKQIKDRFVFEEDHFQLLNMLIPRNVRNRNPLDLSALFKRFPPLSAACNRAEADVEWRSLSVLSLEALGLKTEDELRILPAEAFWILVLNLKNPTGGLMCRTVLKTTIGATTSASTFQ